MNEWLKPCNWSGDPGKVRVKRLCFSPEQLYHLITYILMLPFVNLKW